jgi:hypothetical protein
MPAPGMLVCFVLVSFVDQIPERQQRRDRGSLVAALFVYRPMIVRRC